MWTVGIFALRTGAPVLQLQPSEGSWESRLKGQGRGRHVFRLHGSDIPQSVISELSKGNKYAIAQMWDTHVAFAGVIHRRSWSESTETLVLDSVELRAGYMNDRMLYGVPEYDPSGTVLAVSGKSRSGAARAVLQAAMPNSDWALPIDLPADGSGSFSATWAHNERLKLEDHLAQIESDGCEIDFLPYLDGDGSLRWQTRVATTITSGSATDHAAKAPGSRVVDLQVVTDYTREATGVLGFGKGGLSAPTKWAGNSGVDISVRDTWASFPDLEEARLQNAVDALFAVLETPTDQWSFGMHIWPDGPEAVAPGCLLNLWVYGSKFIPDGSNAKRVIAVRGDLGFTVYPEVQDAP